MCDDMKVPDKLEECVEILIQAGWSPSKEHVQRNERLRATPIEHCDEEVTIELESGNHQYLSSRTTDDLKAWLKQHQISHHKTFKIDLIKLVQRHYANTTPLRPMVPKARLCPKTSRPTTTKKRITSQVRQQLSFVMEDSHFDRIDFNMDTDDDHCIDQKLHFDDETMALDRNEHEDGCAQQRLRFHFC